MQRYTRRRRWSRPLYAASAVLMLDTLLLPDPPLWALLPGALALAAAIRADGHEGGVW